MGKIWLVEGEDNTVFRPRITVKIKRNKTSERKKRNSISSNSVPPAVVSRPPEGRETQNTEADGAGGWGPFGSRFLRDALQLVTYFYAVWM